MRQILLIEDEENFARFIELELVHESYSVTKAFDGREGLGLALEREWDIILLDVMLPEINGMEICRRIRAVQNTPILMITARDSIGDRVSGLDSGADDYIPKPFAIEELLARIRALLRRFENSEEARQGILKFRDLILDPESRVVRKGDIKLDLTKREFDLLHVFMQNINRVLPRDVLLDKIWGYDADVERNTVDVYISYLRKKIDGDSMDSCIQTLRGIGYVMR